MGEPKFLEAHSLVLILKDDFSEWKFKAWEEKKTSDLHGQLSTKISKIRSLSGRRWPGSFSSHEAGNVFVGDTHL